MWMILCLRKENRSCILSGIDHWEALLPDIFQAIALRMNMGDSFYYDKPPTRCFFLHRAGGLHNALDSLITGISVRVCLTGDGPIYHTV